MARHTHKKSILPFRHKKKLTRWQKIKKFFRLGK